MGKKKKHSPILADVFELAFASITGNDHRKLHLNNQDAVNTIIAKDYILAIVTDGVGEPRLDEKKIPSNSEVGAKIGAKIITQAIVGMVEGYPAFFKQVSEDQFYSAVIEILESARRDVVAQLTVLAKAMGGSYTEVVLSYFMFTVVGIFITPSFSTFFSIGDGFIVINEEIINLGPFPRNEPPLLAQSLLPGVRLSEETEFKIARVIPTTDIESFLIGSDGIDYFIRAEGKKVPGKDEEVGSLSQFWINDKYFINPDAVRRRLGQVAKHRQKIDYKGGRVERENGYLRDDTTIVVGRRQKEVS